MNDPALDRAHRGQQLFASVATDPVGGLPRAHAQLLNALLLELRAVQLDLLLDFAPGQSLVGQNLNRVFPGRADGTLSERIAHTITRDVIERATHVIDLHCGDGNESLRPYTYWITTGRPEVAEAGREMALAFGMDHVVVDRERPLDPAGSIYVSNTAVTRGKPALTIESGALAGTDHESIARIVRGIAGVMKHLGMRAEGPPPVAHPIMLERTEVLRSGATGMFYPQVERGHTVAEGTLIGHITDFHGRLLEEIRAPFAGEILYVVGTPPISKGEPIAFVAAGR